MAQSDSAHDELLMQGRKLSPEEVKELQTTADVDPTDLESRIELLGYYFGKSLRSTEAGKAQQKLVLWLIKNHPELPVAGSPETHIHSFTNPDGYLQAKRLWLETAEEQNDNPIVLGNAASFFLLSDRSQAEDLLKKAQAVEPDNPKWSSQLGQLYSLSSHGEAERERRRQSIKALAEYERAMELEKDQRQIYYLLADLAKVAFEAGSTEKAEQYANQLLKMSTEVGQDWNNGNAVHHGNLVLGRLALQSGDIDKAKSYLLEAGKTQGSPQLNSFGPNMTLAKELLEKGEKEVVLEYFQLCGKFWRRKELDQWSAVVNGGGLPEFGANLRY